LSLPKALLSATAAIIVIIPSFSASGGYSYF